MTVTIADIAPYNTYTITCNASLPRDVTGLRLDISWEDVVTGETLTANETITIETVLTQTRGVDVYSSVLRITETVRGDQVLNRRCVAEAVYVMLGMEVNTIPITMESATARVTMNGMKTVFDLRG